MLAKPVPARLELQGCHGGCMADRGDGQPASECCRLSRLAASEPP